jgi:hypothetical protein
LGLVPDRGLGFLDFHDGGQHVKIPPVITLDFETEAIGQRPDYPPKPVSFSIQMPGERRPTFHAWGHPEGNNTNLKTARRILQDAEKMKLPFLFHNAKFDAEVLMEFFDIELAWDRMHDDMFLLYLYDPHAKDLKLKPSAERLLGEAPNEQDAVRDWVLQNKRMLEAKYGGSVKPSQFGAWISKVPAQIVGPYANGDVSRTLGLFKYLCSKRMTANDALCQFCSAMNVKECALIRLDSEGTLKSMMRPWQLRMLGCERGLKHLRSTSTATKNSRKP